MKLVDLAVKFMFGMLFFSCSVPSKTAHPTATNASQMQEAPATSSIQPVPVTPPQVPGAMHFDDVPISKTTVDTPPVPTVDPECKTPDLNTAARMYPWPRRNPVYESTCMRFPTPSGARRIHADDGSYAHWLRHLPLLPSGTPVRRYDGVELTWATSITAAVVDLDVGKEDLQQCMDTLIRLRAEYHWSQGRFNAIRFPYAGGIFFSFDEWCRGLRPRKNATGKQELAPTASPSDGRKSFQKYLRFLFAMTGTVHYPTAPRVSFNQLQPGDFFLEPSPSPQQLGHALVILDIARDPSGRTWALIGQGFTPAQDFHILRASASSVWFELIPEKPMEFPSWATPFTWNQVHRFRD